MSSHAHDVLLAVFDSFRMNPATAYFHIDGDLSFRALHAGASTLAASVVADAAGRERTPVVIYGHKDSRYLIAYWACILAGRPLIPIEPETPLARIERICNHAGVSLLLDATAAASAPRALAVKTVPVCPTAPPTLLGPCLTPRVSTHDTMYIMFSSGTSGEPKGIRISYGNVVDFLQWLKNLFFDFGPIEAISGNVRFCFDVSLFEIWSSWLLGRPISALDHREFINSRKYIERFRKHRLTTWISTPTMVQRYLADPHFHERDIPTLNTFLFCGEVLPKSVVNELWTRFRDCRVFNTYGPTECTVAVTGVRILPSHVASISELPIGYARPGTQLELMPRQPGDARGEIMIQGAAVSPGYLHCPEKQAHSFPAPQTYRTGDWGHVDDQGLWYFEGRQDREHKIQGFRIDLNDVEACIRRIPGVIDVLVDVQCLKGEPRWLRAFVLGPLSVSDLQAMARSMALELPSYLVPRFWYALLDSALDQNGKRKVPEIDPAANQIGVRFVYNHDSVDR